MNVIAYKCTAEDDTFAGSFNITGELDIKGVTTEAVHLNEYVTCRCNEKWWIGVVDEVNKVD
jgi:hypothetical protein